MHKRMKRLQGTRRLLGGVMLFLCLLLGTRTYAIDVDLWLRVERVDSLFKQGRVQEALVMGEELLPVVVESEDALSEAHLRLILGECLRFSGMEQEAMSQLEKAAKLVETPKFKRLEGRTQRHLAAMVMATLAMSEMEKGKTEQGAQHARLSITWVRQLNDKKVSAFILPYMGHVLLRCGYSDEALPILEEGENLAHQQGLPQYEKIAGEDLAEIQGAKDEEQDVKGEEQGTKGTKEPFMALKDSVSGKYAVPSDSMHDHAARSEVQGAESREQGVRESWWQHRQVRFLGVTVVVVMLVLLGLYWFWQQRVRHRISQLEEDSESRYQEGKEEERNRLAKEMHDGVSNQLLAIEMKLQSDGLTPQTMQMLSESREQVRRVSHELMPPNFEHATLDESLRNYVEELNGVKGCEISYRSEYDQTDWGDIPQEKSLAIYRIVQETVSNVLKHAGATLIAVVLQRKEGKIFITVADNGKNDGTVSKERGIGLRTMQQRVDAIGGRIKTSTRQGLRLFMLEV